MNVKLEKSRRRASGGRRGRNPAAVIEPIVEEVKIVESKEKDEDITEKVINEQVKDEAEEITPVTIEIEPEPVVDEQSIKPLTLESVEEVKEPEPAVLPEIRMGESTVSLEVSNAPPKRRRRQRSEDSTSHRAFHMVSSNSPDMPREAL